jgi:protein-L-isoaspartate(D-aspartate) O-methyltransferase
MDPIDTLIREIEQETRATRHWTGRERLQPTVLRAMRAVPRDHFVPPASREAAWMNTPLPIGHGKTISQPFIVALMTDLLDLERAHRVLEIGTGSGYQAAILAELCDDVASIESVPALAERAAEVLRREGYGAIALRTTDGHAGWLEKAPFDRIIVTAAARAVPPALLEQLRPGGRMVVPVGEPGGEQALRLLCKKPDGTIVSRTVLPVMFVPLTGGDGV